MSRRRRRQEAEDLVRRFQKLRPAEASWITLVLVSNAFILFVVQVVLVASYIRAARGAFRVHRDGSRATARGAHRRPLVALTCAHAMHLIYTRTLLSRWTRRAVRRAEASAQPPEDSFGQVS